MKSIVVRQCLGLLAFLVFAVSYAYGDDVSYRSATLTICNKGSEQVNVAVAIRDSLWPVPPFNSWEVSGWKSIVPGHCERVYRETGEPAYIGFAFFDSQNHFTGAGHIEQAPDFGWNGFTRVLTRSDKRLCVQGSQGMAYKIRNDPTPAVDCASFHSGGNDPGGYVPLASALYFVPNVTECRSGVGIFSGQVSCTGGDYYVNVKPTASDRELHASAGSESGKDQSPVEPSIGDAILKELGKAAAEKSQKEEQAQATGRKNVTVCVPDSLMVDWKNPPPGSKMERFKQHFRDALRTHAKDPSQDMTVWWWIDDRVYPTYDPATPLGKAVFSYTAGTCGRTGNRETLAINP